MKNGKKFFSRRDRSCACPFDTGDHKGSPLQAAKTYQISTGKLLTFNEKELKVISINGSKMSGTYKADFEKIIAKKKIVNTKYLNIPKDLQRKVRKKMTKDLGAIHLELEKALKSIGLKRSEFSQLAPMQLTISGTITGNEPDSIYVDPDLDLLKNTESTISKIEAVLDKCIWELEANKS